MNRLFRIILISMVIISLWATARIQDQVTELESRTKQNFGYVTDWSYQVDQHLLRHKGRIDDLAKVLDLSVLDSCGIITDGLGFGSCVAVGPDLILTAGHCEWYVEHWIEIGGVRYEIIEEWASESCDVRFIKIEGVLPYMELGQMPELLDEVYLVGSPYDTAFSISITKGVISHLDRDIWGWEDLIQTDAEGAPGSSGCPLFNESGQVIGICVSGATPGGGVTLCESVDNIRLALAEYLE